MMTMMNAKRICQPIATILLKTTLLLSPLTPASSSSTHAVFRWKAPNSQTPAHQTSQWKQEDEALHAYIASSVPAVLEHTGSDAFDAHLKGVQAVLRYWGSPKHLYNAGVFHSICEWIIIHTLTFQCDFLCIHLFYTTLHYIHT